MKGQPDTTMPLRASLDGLEGPQTSGRLPSSGGEIPEPPSNGREGSPTITGEATIHEAHALNRLRKAVKLAAELWTAEVSDDEARAVLLVMADKKFGADVRVSASTADWAMATLGVLYEVLGSREDIEAEAVGNHRPRPMGV